MQLSNSKLAKQHEKLTCILNLAIRSKNKAFKAMAEINRMKAAQISYTVIGETIFQLTTYYREAMYVYERLMQYYRKQLLRVIGDDYVHVNSFASSL
ncbi:hypothetical protein SAMN05661012_00356 [Chitinophaga sancti]|uniref:Uncharacterized protein n=1 Tax=Chitinophaga sancti TaxID=1004 RepID=A0A1K1M0U1_9BACT|nr:hypothetical protein SAMN05661012_00356 [Chitinophaga sancti]